jgi:hypothetical protein
VSLEEINQQITSKEFNEMTKGVGGELKQNTIVWKLPSQLGCYVVHPQ